MAGYVIRRTAWAIPILLIASVLVFIVIHETTSPLAALRTNPRVRPEDLSAYRRALGLDRTGYQQYVAWLGNFLRGNWGRSLVTGRAVFPDVREALANTFVLGGAAWVLSVSVGMGIGVISSIRRNSLFDYLTTGGAFLGLSMPPFWFGLVLQLVFGLYLTSWLGLGSPIFPTAGMFTPGSTGFDLFDRLRHLVLPVLALSVQFVAVYSRYMRASMLDVLHSDYVRTARAKGLRERWVVGRHAVRNALIPLTTQAAIDLGSLAGGLVVTEVIFSWPGMGSLFVGAIRNGDYAVVLPWTMVVVVSVIAFNLFADLVYAVLDPRIRYG